MLINQKNAPHSCLFALNILKITGVLNIFNRVFNNFVVENFASVSGAEENFCQIFKHFHTARFLFSKAES